MSNNRNRSRRSRNRSKPEAYEPVQISTKRSPDEPEPERLVLFYIDGEAYSVPTQLPPAIGLRYLRDIREGGNTDYAMAGLLTEAMGEQAFDALADCDQVDGDAMARIVDKVMEIALGAAGQGKS